MSEGPDLLSIGSGGKLSRAPAAAPVTTGDPAVWTILGEAGDDPEGQRAVASVIANRADRRMADPSQLVTDPAEGFEAWQAHQDDLRKRYPPGSEAYEAAKARVQKILTRQEPAPYSYDSFYSPQAQKALGRQPPDFEDGSGADIGGNRFFADTYQLAPPPDLTQIARKKAADTELAGGQDIAGDTKKPFTPEQTKTHLTLAKGLLLDPSKPEGDVQNPWMQRNPQDTFAPGHFYIAPDGMLRQQAGAEDKAGVGTGVGESLNDLGASMGRLFPDTGDSELGNRFRGNRLIFDAAHGDNTAAQVGRIGGQLLTAVPLTVGGGEGLGLLSAAATKAAPAIAPVADFLGGSASAFRANPLLWGASKATAGAAQGAGASLLTSGTSDESLGQQVTRGAEAGAILGPTLPAVAGAFRKVGGAARSLVEPFSEAGRNRIVDRFLAERAQGGPTALDLTEHVPGSAPTLAQATANPGLATLERGVKAVNPTPFAMLHAANEQARELAVDAVRGDKQSLDDLVAHRASQTDPLRDAAFANTTPVDPAPVVAAIDQALASPAGQRDAVQSALTGIRGKLVGADGAMQTDPAQLWGVRQAIGDMLSPLSAGTKSDGRLASRELMGVRDALDPVIESGAPGFQDYLEAYAEQSKGVNAAGFLQGLKLTDSKGSITLGRIDSALTRIEAMRAKGGANPAKDVPDELMTKLYAVRDDLRRQGNSELGRGTGSDTVQKLGSNQLLNTLSIPAALGIGISHPLAGAAVGLGRMAYGAKNKELFNLLTGKLIDPAVGAPALDQVYAPASVPNRLISMAGRAPLPAATMMANRLFAPAGAQ
jgi:hypothetical protein